MANKTKLMRITPQIARLKSQYDKTNRQIGRIAVTSEYDRLMYKLLDEKRNAILDKMNSLIGSEHYEFNGNVIVVY